MKRIGWLFLSCMLFVNAVYADTMDHYMHIASSIPTMELKADAEAQAWARSARNVLIITNESIAETMLEANRLAQENGRPLFCLPPNVTLDAATLKSLIEEHYPSFSSPQVNKEKLTVSEMAWRVIRTQYSCSNPKIAALQAISGISAMQHDER